MNQINIQIYKYLISHADVPLQEHPPIAWMSPEAVFNNQYTEASDVWGLAVLFWELYSFGMLWFDKLYCLRWYILTIEKDKSHTSNFPNETNAIIIN